ncbi:MAG: DUF2914 domain-containing protein [Deltaproteobacteria bacterium]|nr:DUF2914 domain-containing protein [Deltaproteobacteria bacterium]
MFRYFAFSLVLLLTVIVSQKVFAEPTMVELMFARDVVLREPVRPFKPGAYCESEPEPAGPIPVVNSQEENRVFFWSLFTNASEGILRHSWVKGDVEVYGENIEIGESGWWRSWSGKEIVAKEDAGRWKLVVSKVGEPNDVICVVHFLIK